MSEEEKEPSRVMVSNKSPKKMVGTKNKSIMANEIT